MWLKLEAVPDSLFRVTWGNSRGRYPVDFTVGAETIRDAGEAIREQLTELSRWSSDPLRSPSRRRAILQKLAEAGSDLRYELFNAPSKRGDVKKLNAWIDAERLKDSELCIQADASIHVPWGLIFDGNVPTFDSEPKDTQNVRGEVDAFAGFWCLRFMLSATQSGCYLSDDRMNRPRESFGLVSLVNQKVQDEVKRRRNPDDGYADVFSPPVGEANTLSECESMIATTDKTDLLFYFFGHHSKNRLVLANEVLKFSQVGRLIDRLAEKIAEDESSCGLLFLNACSSAVGRSDFNFRRYANRPELCGVIATEAIVPSVYADKLGRRVLGHLIKKGTPLAQTMYDLYRDPDMWPECLLYGCYAHASYKVSAEASAPSPEDSLSCGI